MFRRLYPVLLGGLFLLLLTPFFEAKALVIENPKTHTDITVTNDISEDLLVKGTGRIIVEGDVNGDLIIFGDKVQVIGDVEGNVYVLGNEVEIENMVGKSVYVLSGMVDINGSVFRDVYVAGGRVNVRGEVSEDVLVAGGDVIIQGNVGDDIRTIAGTVRVEGTVAGDVVSASGNTTINSTVDGSVLTKGPTDLQDSVIQGDFVAYTDNDEVVKYSSSTIQGNRSIKGYEEMGHMFEMKPFSFSEVLINDIWTKTFWSMFQCFGIVILGYLLFKFAPVRLESTMAKMNDPEEVVKSFLTGFIAFPVGTFIALVLAFTVFGWPLLKVLVLLALLATSVVTPIAGIILGRKILPVFGSKRRYVVPLTLGVVIIQLLKTIPIIGWIFYQIVVFVVIGAMLRMQWSKYQIAQNMRVRITK